MTPAQQENVTASSTVEPDSTAVELLQRVIFPRPGEPIDVRSLYLVESASNARRAHAPSRTSVVLGAESEVSFESYFNAFAAAYWRRWSILTSVVLRVEVIGTCRVDLYRSKVDGSRIGIGGDLVPIDENGRGTIEFELDLGPFEDGGWIWFDVTTDTETEIVSAGWYSAIPVPSGPDTKRVTVGIPTFNRPTDAVNALAALTSDPLVDEVIDAVLMPDQARARSSTSPVTRKPLRHWAIGCTSSIRQPRWFRWLLPHHVRGVAAHRLPLRPVHGRRHRDRARLDPARAGDVTVRPHPHAGRWADAEPAGPQSPALHG